MLSIFTRLPVNLLVSLVFCLPHSLDDIVPIYPLRKETIERVYADCKEKHGLRFTRIRGLKKNQQESLIIFGCHNLGKLARMKKRRGLINMTSPNKKERHIRKIVQIYQFA